MRKIILSILTLLSVTSLSAATVYCKMAQSWWTADGAAVGVHYWGGGTSAGTTWPGVRMSPVSGQDGMWSYDVPSDVAGLIFTRVNGSGDIIYWDAKTKDLKLPTDGKNLYTITSASAVWGDPGCDGEWSVFDGEGGGDTPGGGGSDPITPGDDYSSAVPSECTDVMLQAFYWGSNSNTTYGGSQWSTLQSQASEISQYFQLVWLPPSCLANDNMGYLPKQYPNQNSKMGMKAGLKNLINALHNGGTRVLADVVINHAANSSSWNDFVEQDFGTYGKFQPQSSWITSDDEAKSKGYSVGTNADDGQESNRNYGSARDWDHKSSNVQAMCKAYLKFLKGEIGYDGYRFDYCGGYHVSHINDYVSAAKPYISVMEYWNGDANVLKNRIDDASKNTMTFDFASFYTAYQQGIASNNYNKLVKPGLRGKNYQKYAVNFIDNHDTFNRGDINNADCGNKKDGSSINNKELIMQCNAYMLSMPGIPCVFWPHWYTYKSDIKAMITARRSAGIHSESEVSETSGSGYYEATVTGKYGKVVLYLGSSASKAAPAGYKQAVKGAKYAMYYIGTMPQAVENVEIEQPMLDKTSPMFNIMGLQVDANYRGIVIQNGNKYLLQ